HDFRFRGSPDFAYDYARKPNVPCDGHPGRSATSTAEFSYEQSAGERKPQGSLVSGRQLELDRVGNFEGTAGIVGVPSDETPSRIGQNLNHCSLLILLRIQNQNFIE